jgi:hypothetical protein
VKAARAPYRGLIVPANVAFGFPSTWWTITTDCIKRRARAQFAKRLTGGLPMPNFHIMLLQLHRRRMHPYTNMKYTIHLFVGLFIPLLSVNNKPH